MIIMILRKNYYTIINAYKSLMQSFKVIMLIKIIIRIIVLTIKNV